MKKLLTILLIYFFVININAQGEEEETSPAVELFFITENLPDTPIATFKLSIQSKGWGNTFPNTFYPGNYYLTNNFNEDIYIPLYNNMGQASAGFDFVSSQQGYPVFAYGLYKITSDITDKYFYIDYRDQRVLYYAEFNPPTVGHQIDIWILYDASDDIFYYSSFSSSSDFIQIQNGELLNIWDIKEKGSPLTDLLPDYWQNSLAVIDENFHPKLIWSTDSDEITVTSYKIYRAISWEDSETPPSSNNFIFLNQVNSSTDQYVDYNTLINGKSNIWYKIIAYNGTTEVEEFNIVKTNYTNDMWGKSFNVTKYNNNTHLEWKGYYDEVNNYLDYYRIYRAVTGSGSTFFDPPGQGSFSLIGSVMAELLDLYTFTDYEISTSGQLNVYYYIKPLTMYNQELEPTEIVGMKSVSLSKEATKNEKNDFEIKYTLLQNHPNPFNPVTNIKYQIKEKGFVTIKIFDILGNEITTLVNEIKDAGVYSIVFDGSKLPSGVYIYNMQTHDITLIQKMTLIK